MDTEVEFVDNVHFFIANKQKVIILRREPMQISKL